MWHSVSGSEAHAGLEAVAYLIGAGMYARAARHSPQPPATDRVLLLGAALLGALVGSKLLHVLQHFPALMARQGWALWLGGKSVLGGFLGGTLSVELVKKAIRWATPTGDPFVPALAAGLVVGRLGCQLSGTWDQTYGVPTALPWAWDYGDGVGRHPTALYEMALVALAYGLTRVTAIQRRAGAAFASFLLCYCAIRFGLEWLKPPFGDAAPGSLPVALYAGLTAIQWAALLGLAWYALLLRSRLATSRED